MADPSPPESVIEVAPKLKLREFTESAVDSIIHFQILELEDQLYVWIGSGGARMESLHTAMMTKFDNLPVVATHFGEGAVGDGAALAQRLSKKTGKAVSVSCSLPPNTPLLQAVAEKRLIKELTQPTQVADPQPPSENTETASNNAQ
jgi:proteasome assembly chaperone 4